VSRRTERVASLIRTVVAEAIQNRLSDPRILPLTSVTRTEVSADLSVARVHVSVMADERRRELCVRALRHAAGRLRSFVAEAVTLRQVPRLEFHLDDSVQRSFETVETLDRIMTEMGERPAWDLHEQEDAAAEEGDACQEDD
jgi:ribosome-binding factor A